MNNEQNYLPKYQKIPWWRHNEIYNDLMKKMENLYCKWYGSAYGLTHNHVQNLMEDIMTGKTSFSKWKKEFEEANIRANMGLGPNDPIPKTPKCKVNLSKVSTEDLINELNKRMKS